MNMKEIWLPVNGYEGLYEVSNFGRILSLPRKFASYKVLKPVMAKCGYMVVCLHKNKKQKNHYIHSLVLNAFLGNKIGYQCNHKNADKTDNNLFNLEWSTGKENNQHARKLGLQKVPRGEELPQSKLNDDKVRRIRKLYNSGIKSLVYLSKIFQIGKGSIFHVVHYKTWRHIKDD